MRHGGREVDEKFWRDKAEEARTLADKMNHPVSKMTMLRIAEDYDRLAGVEAQNRREQLTGRRTK